jgi:hypothetical protein
MENKIRKDQRLYKSPAIITTTNIIAVSALVLNVCQLNAMLN